MAASKQGTVNAERSADKAPRPTNTATELRSIAMSDSESTKPITAMAIKAMKVGETLSDTAENRGLRITRTREDYRWWYRYTDPETSKAKRLLIGHLSQTGLAEVRVEFKSLKRQRRDGNVPELSESFRPALVPTISDEIAAGGVTVGSVVEKYLEMHVFRNRQLKGAKETERMLRADVLGGIWQLPVDQLTRRQLVDRVREHADAGKNAQAGKILQEFTAAIEYAIGTDVLPDEFVNVGLLAKRSLQQAKVKLTANRRKRYLDDNELRLFLEWLPGSGFSQNHRFAMLLALETGCRTGEAICAEWKHFDLDAGTWSLPRTKTNEPRQIKLPAQTLEWLTAASLVASASRYLCPSPYGGHVNQKSITETAWHIRKDGKMLDIPHWTPHDLRRTCRTGLARLGCPRPVAEAILGHTAEGIVSNYDLHGYFEEAGKWLQQWADHLDKLRPVKAARLRIVR